MSNLPIEEELELQMALSRQWEERSHYFEKLYLDMKHQYDRLLLKYTEADTLLTEIGERDGE